MYENIESDKSGFEEWAQSKGCPFFLARIATCIILAVVFVIALILTVAMFPFVLFTRWKYPHMKKYLPLPVITALALLTLTGCASTAASKIIKALGNDPATVSIRVNGWGTVIEVSRANPVIGMNSTVATDGSLNVTTESVKGVPGTVAAPQRAVAHAAVDAPKTTPARPAPHPRVKPATSAPAPVPVK